MVKAKVFIGCIAIEICLLLAVCLHGGTGPLPSRLLEVEAKKALVSRLGLTDLAIWTEARYTRHPSQADFFSAFQDFPGAPDHFPAGSIIAPVGFGSGARL